MGKMIRDRISAEVRLSGFFSLMADETKDVSKQEQLSIVVRYVDREGIINERFLTFVGCIFIKLAQVHEGSSKISYTHVYYVSAL